MTLEEVKRIPMREVVAMYGFTMNRAGFIHCPFHSGDKGASLKVYEKDWFCHACCVGGDQIEFVRRMDGLSFREAFMRLGGTYDTGNGKEIREKVRQAELRRKEKAAKEAAVRAELDAHNRYITLMRNGLDCFPVFSDEWCFCQNKLSYLLYVHDEMSEMRAKNEAYK